MEQALPVFMGKARSYLLVVLPWEALPSCLCLSSSHQGVGFCLVGCLKEKGGVENRDSVINYHVSRGVRIGR